MSFSVTLLKIKERNLEEIMNWRTSADVTKYMFSDPVLTIEKQKMWYEKIKTSVDCIYWVICANEIPIGLIGITDISNKIGELTWYIGSPEYRGKGIAKNVLAAVMKFVFSKNMLDIIISDVFKENTNAIKIYEKCGFKEYPCESYIFKKHNENHEILRFKAYKENFSEKTMDKLYNAVVYIEE